ncbi:MAG: hypothetical protein ACFBSG_11700 [Leptolyngbyaceae cyanobacterium]
MITELGKLSKDPQAALRLTVQAQSLYEAIGDRYSQCRNLTYFLADAQLWADQKDAAIGSLRQAIDLALRTEFELFGHDAQRKLSELGAAPLVPAMPQPAVTRRPLAGRSQLLVGGWLGLAIALLLWWLI